MANGRCPDNQYRGCDFMGCEGWFQRVHGFPLCPHLDVARAIRYQEAADLAIAQGFAHQYDRCLVYGPDCAECAIEEAFYNRQMEGDPF